MNRALASLHPVLFGVVLPVVAFASCTAGIPGTASPGASTGAPVSGGGSGVLGAPISGLGSASGSGGRAQGGVDSIDGTTSGGTLPCEVARVLETKCQLCHGTMPDFGASISLVTFADTQAPAPSHPASKVWEVMRQRVHATTAPMPPNGQPALTLGTGGELGILDAWFAAGAPAQAGACDVVGQATGGKTGNGSGAGSSSGGGSGGPSGSGGAAGSNGISAPVGAGIGPQYLPCTPSHIMTAHAPGSITTKYPVPNPTSDSYMCFNFKSPFAAGEQATAFAPVIDDSRVIHHFILYGTTSTLTDGSIQANCAASGTHVAGWAPGGQNVVLDPDVGLKLDYPYFQLQVHYNNQRYADGADASGVAICSTTTPRTNEAGIVTLGAGFFSIPAKSTNYAVKATCSGGLATDGKTPITVIGTSPHMHLLGTGFTTEHLRSGASMGDLSNIPLGSWSFDDQRHYAITPRRQVMPGDTLKTTCYFSNPSSSPVSFGQRTSDEMCFDFITAYPYAAAKKFCAM